MISPLMLAVSYGEESALASLFIIQESPSSIMGRNLFWMASFMPIREPWLPPHKQNMDRDLKKQWGTHLFHYWTSHQTGVGRVITDWGPVLDDEFHQDGVKFWENGAQDPQHCLITWKISSFLAALSQKTVLFFSKPQRPIDCHKGNYRIQTFLGNEWIS